MKIKQLSKVFICAALCTSLMAGCGERKEVSLSDNPDENTVSSVSTVSSVLTGSSSSDGSSVSDTSSETSEPLASSDASSAESTVSSSTSAESSDTSTASAASAPTESSSDPQSDAQPTSESTSSEHHHQYSVTKTVEPTCSEVGYELYKCSCGDQYAETTAEPLGHDYSTAKTDPTCTAGGYTTYTCKRCGQSHKDDYAAAQGHKYSTQTVKPTCTQKGYTLNTCTRCGDERKSDYTNALEHKWGEWTVTKNATTSSEGEKVSECSRCGETQKASIPKLKADSSTYVAEVVRLVNIEREKRGLSKLTMRSDLNDYAQLRSTEIVTKFEHVRPDGANPLKFVLSLSGIRTAGENIAYGYNSPESVMQGWMNSQGHRENILNGAYSSIGVGCYEYGGRLYWTQIFAG